MTARSKLNPILIYKHPSSTVKASSMDQDTLYFHRDIKNLYTHQKVSSMKILTSHKDFKKKLQ